MNQRIGMYSRFVAITKVVLPIIAIGLLATIFLVTEERSIEGGLRFSRADLETLESGMRVVKPRFSGSNAQGDVYTFAANLLIPDSPTPQRLDAEGLSGEIKFFSGSSIELSAGRAELGMRSRALRLEGGINIVFNDGLRASTEGLLAELDIGRLTSDGPVSATSSLGSISAGNFRSEMIAEDDEENRMIWFENGVKLTFKIGQPTDEKAEE